MTTQDTTREFLRSDCGKYFARPLAGLGTDYFLYASNGSPIGEATCWINESTNSRVGFAIGYGPHSAHFSYPRFPAWFKRRWVECFDIDLKELATMAKACGCDVLVGYKPGINCWHHLGLRCSRSSLAAFDLEMMSRGLKFETRQKPSHWNIDCPRGSRCMKMYSLPHSS